MESIESRFPREEDREEELAIPEYGLDEGVERLIHTVKEQISEKDDNIIVEIAGGSASGKTSAVADMVTKAFGEEALAISADDYYKGKTFIDAEAAKGNILNWDQPEVVNLKLLQQHLAELRIGNPIEKPIYDFKTGESVGTETVYPQKVIVVEGLFVLDDILKQEGDIKAFVDIGTHGRITRRLLRDVQRTGQRPADILKYFAQVVEPMHDKYIQSTKKNADIIINNEYNPETEAQRSGMHELQVKFKYDLDADMLRKLGAEKLGSTTQIDRYYNPKDRDLTQTGESLRIREEGTRRTLTYKGPKVESQFRERPKFEFDIDEETEGAFLEIYGDMQKTIIKERTLYQLDGLVLSIDNVQKQINGEEVDLGNFVEIRTTDRDSGQEQILSVMERLGFDMNDAIRESYVEM